LPAVQKVREAAARAQCQNNLKQVALALHNYENTYEEFPERSWIVDLLPYIEQSAVAQGLYSGDYSIGGLFYTALAAKLPLLFCPSEPRGHVNWTENPPYSSGPPTGLTWYVAVMGLDHSDGSPPASSRSGILSWTEIFNPQTRTYVNHGSRI